MIAGLLPYPEVRDSGVAWLGDVPEHWAISRVKPLLRRVQRPVHDGAGVVTCFRDGVVTLRSNRRTAGFTPSLKEIGYQGICKGDLVIHAMDAFAGAIGVSDSDGKGTPVYAVCEPSPLANASYFARVAREMARNGWILALAKGIRERSTDFRYDTFAAQHVPLPPLKEQVAIVRFLDHADRRIRRSIAAKQKMIRLLEEQKVAVVHQVVTRGLNPDAPIKASGVDWLGDIPAHWEIKRFKNLTTHIVDCLHATPEYVDDGGYPAIRTADVEPGHVRLAGARKVDAEHFARWTARLAPRAGDILYSREGERYGIAATVPEGAPLCISQRMMVFRLRADQVSDYVMWQLNCPHVYEKATQDVGGSTAPHINISTIRNYELVVPPPDEQRAIVAQLGSELARIKQTIITARREIELLGEYRARLVADVVTGRLDVRTVADKLEEEPEGSVPVEKELALDEEAEFDEVEAEEEVA